MSAIETIPILATGLVCGIGFGYYIAYKFKVVKARELERKELYEYELEVAHTQEVIARNREEATRVMYEIAEYSQKLQETIENETSIVRQVLEKEQELAHKAYDNYMETLTTAMWENEELFDQEAAKLKEELDKLKSARTANIEAALREKELQEKENFYKITVSKADLEDIEILEDVKRKIRRVDVISKLIWTNYYQKSTTTLCNNVVGEQVKCGIYKITDSITGLTYIGQSVNIAQRWKDHVKAALGATTAAASNKLYAQMRESGVHNFTFEVLEIVPATQLNEKERYWISFYQSDVYGLNSNKGVKNV